jgi:phage-related protein (TIGR01555 family)
MKKALASTKSRPIARPVRIKDGVLSLVSSINNNRNALNTNAVFSPRLDYPEMRELYKTGIGNKIISIKADYALRDALQFENQVDEAFYKLNLAKQVKEAFKFALGFGRGIIVIVEIGVDLYQPLSPGFTRDSKFKLNVFSGDLVTAYGVSFDLMDYNFYKPEYYTVRGYQFHRSRVIEFNYIEPPQFDLPTYQYGGMSEFQLIRTAMITDGIVQRAGASILEKNSSLFYKITGFKDLLNSGEEADIINFFNILENNRSIYGAGMIDMEDDVTSVTQSLTDIDKVDQMSLRRLAMVTNIPLPMLVGENVQGLNSSGTTELQVFNWMLQNLRDSYAIDPISRLATLMGLGLVSFKKTNEMTPEQLAAYESTIIDNAAKLSGMGEDGQSYLVEKA